MKSRRLSLLLIVLVSLLLLAGCRAKFPTGKFAHLESGANRHLIFYPDGRWEGFSDGNLISFGSYTTDGDRITFQTDFQCSDAGAPETAAYTWKHQNNTLTFQSAAEDLCSARVAMLAGEFKRSE